MPTFTEPPNSGKGQIRPLLRLVHPAPPKPPRERHRRASTFTADEETRLKAALRNARTLFGTWRLLAAAMGVQRDTLARAAMARKILSADVAVRVARALGVPVDSLLRPPTDAARCSTCGRGAP